jgi:hypothetical protein
VPAAEVPSFAAVVVEPEPSASGRGRNGGRDDILGPARSLQKAARNECASGRRRGTAGRTQRNGEGQTDLLAQHEVAGLVDRTQIFRVLGKD